MVPRRCKALAPLLAAGSAWILGAAGCASPQEAQLDHDLAETKQTLAETRADLSTAIRTIPFRCSPELKACVLVRLLRNNESKTMRAELNRIDMYDECDSKASAYGAYGNRIVCNRNDSI